jgi:hypothetical protein
MCFVFQYRDAANLRLIRGIWIYLKENISLKGLYLLPNRAVCSNWEKQ